MANEDAALFWRVYSKPQEVSHVFYKREVRLLQERAHFMKKLEEQKDNLQKQLLEWDAEVDTLKSYFDLEKAEEVPDLVYHYSKREVFCASLQFAQEHSGCWLIATSVQFS